MESVASFYQQSSHLQGVFQNKVMPIKLSDEQELEVAGRLFALSEAEQDLASYYGVNLSEISRIKLCSRSAEDWAKCFAAAANYC